VFVFLECYAASIDKYLPTFRVVYWSHLQRPNSPRQIVGLVISSSCYMHHISWRKVVFLTGNNNSRCNLEPIPASARSKTWVCGRSFAGIAGSNPAEGMDVCLLLSVVCCQVQVSTSGWLLVQRNPINCVVSECGLKASILRRPWPSGAIAAGEGGGGGIRGGSLENF
jgi:hypothetical protein